MKRVLVLGGGFGGVAAARHLGNAPRDGDDVEVRLISRSNFLTYTPFLADVAGGTIALVHAVPPLRAMAPHARNEVAEVESIDVAAQRVEVRLPDGSADDARLRLPGDRARRDDELPPRRRRRRVRPAALLRGRRLPAAQPRARDARAGVGEQRPGAAPRAAHLRVLRRRLFGHRGRRRHRGPRPRSAALLPGDRARRAAVHPGAARRPPARPDRRAPRRLRARGLHEAQGRRAPRRRGHRGDGPQRHAEHGRGRAHPHGHVGGRHRGQPAAARRRSAQGRTRRRAGGPQPAGGRSRERLRAGRLRGGAHRRPRFVLRADRPERRARGPGGRREHPGAAARRAGRPHLRLHADRQPGQPGPPRGGGPAQGLQARRASPPGSCGAAST